MDRLLTPCYCHLFDKKEMYFFSRTTHVHIRLLRRHVFFVMYNNYPGQQQPKISRQLYTYGTWCSGNLLFLQSLPQPIPNCDNGCKILGTIYRRMTFGRFMAGYLRFPQKVLHCVLLWRFGHPLLLHMCFIWSEFVTICTPTLMNYLWHQFAIQWTWPWDCCNFFRQCKILKITYQSDNWFRNF